MLSGEIIRSLNRSKIRLSVLRYINSRYPNLTYLSEIAFATSIQATNVIGGLRGFTASNSTRYNEDLSLVGLGLVETVNKNGKIYYKIKDKAKVDEIVLMYPVRKFVEVEI